MLPINCRCPRCGREFSEMVNFEDGPPFNNNRGFRFLRVLCWQCQGLNVAPAFRKFSAKSDQPKKTAEELRAAWGLDGSEIRFDGPPQKGAVKE